MLPKTDLYVKCTLTLITVFLGLMTLGPLYAPQTAHAANRLPYTVLQFDSSLSQIETSSGSMMGRVAIDLRTGNVYGFPTGPLGYPRDPAKSDVTVSDPILLGRFNLDKVPN